LQSGEGIWSREEKLPDLETLRVKMAVMARGGDHASGHTTQRRDFQEQYAHIPERWSHDLGVTLGVLVGDGWLSESSGSPVGFAFSEPELLAQVHEPMKRWFGAGHVHQRSSVMQLTYSRLPYEFFRTLGVAEARAHEKRTPESIWQAPREAVVGFLQGLFSADGSVQVNQEKMDCTVRLASSSRALLQDVQVLLSNFGIMARLHQRRNAGERLLPDGKGGHAMYPHHAQYELIIGKANRDRFAETIGFLQSEKQDKLRAFIQGKKRASNRETYQDTILSIEDAGIADVYDLTQPDTHSLIANGLVCHNCGEQWLGPYENCCLGSVNLAQHVTDEGRVDWDGLGKTVANATRFLDNVVEVNAYVPSVPQLKEAAHRVRRIGMGVMGLADVMYATGVRYGSPESIELAEQLMEFVRYQAMKTSIELAQARGPFPAISGSIYDPEDLKWSPPEPLHPYTQDFGRPEVDWDAIVAGVKTHGIRNGAQTTIAPTGTIGTVTGCEGYGCEPVFALAYTRYVKESDGDVALTYASPKFLDALEKAGIEEDTKAEIIEQVKHDGSCQGVEALPEAIRHTFVVSMDISPEEHVLMQAALQRFVDNSISKTINFPPDATVEDVKNVYRMAWELGLKGLTVYVTGSRQEVVLETKSVAEAKKGGNGLTAHAQEESMVVSAPQRRPRPSRLMGLTYRRATPLGTAYVTINQTDEKEPFEVFMNVGKAGSDVAAVSEALGRLISYVLRMPSYLSPTERLQQVIYQLAGIGGGRPLGFGPQRVRSLPDAIAQVLDEYLRESVVLEVASPEDSAPPVGQLELPLNQIGDLCPECGQATLLNIEGCKKCINCGYSEC
jgi:ribonucleotide reductase alpha subunit